MKYEYEKDERDVLGFIDADGELWRYVFSSLYLPMNIGTVETCHILGTNMSKATVSCFAMNKVPKDAKKLFYSGDKVTMEF